MVHKISLAPWGEVAPVRVSERGNSLAGLYGLARLVRFICVVHKMSLALWGEVAPVRVSERGSLLAGLYGLARLVRVSCTVVMGIGGEVGRQS